MNEEFGLKYFFFLHNTINLSKKYINEFCDEIIKANLDILWSDCARADNLDRDTLLKMRKAGCVRLVYGLETASPRLMKYIDKQINLKQLENILSWTDEAGIWSGIEIICGFPHETKEDMDMTIEFLNRNKKNIDQMYYNIFYLTYGSRMHVAPERYGLENLSQTDTFKYDRMQVKGLTRISFDEKDSLKWEDKLKQMTECFDHTVEETNTKIACPCFEMEHLLFYLYSKTVKKIRC